MLQNKYLSLIIIILVTFIAPAIGNYSTSAFKEPWYSEIVLPSFNPPSWVFAPIWTSLYILMSFAIWNFWINLLEKRILKIYFIHLFFNCSWTIVFFGFHNVGLALLNLLVILFFIIILMTNYLIKNKLSFYLMIPYFFWSVYAFVLNFTIYIIN